MFRKVRLYEAGPTEKTLELAHLVEIVRHNPYLPILTLLLLLIGQLFSSLTLLDSLLHREVNPKEKVAALFQLFFLLSYYYDSPEKQTKVSTLSTPCL